MARVPPRGAHTYRGRLQLLVPLHLEIPLEPREMALFVDALQHLRRHGTFCPQYDVVVLMTAGLTLLIDSHDLLLLVRTQLHLDASMCHFATTFIRGASLPCNFH